MASLDLPEEWQITDIPRELQPQKVMPQVLQDIAEIKLLVIGGQICPPDRDWPLVRLAIIGHQFS